MDHPLLVLASQSPRRREILKQIGVPFTALEVAVEETPTAGELPAIYASRLAEAKARAGAAALSGSQLVLGADTVVVCDDAILEKPRDKEHALAMWRRLSGRTHQVITALCIVKGDRCVKELSVSEVQFWPLSSAQMEAYWHTGECLDKAGGYAIQGMGAVFVKAMSGSYSGIVGLPIEKLVPLLTDFNMPYWQLTEQGQ